MEVICYAVCAFLFLLLMPVFSRDDGIRAAIIRMCGVASFIVSVAALVFPVMFPLSRFIENRDRLSAVYAVACYFVAMAFIGVGLVLFGHRGDRTVRSDQL